MSAQPLESYTIDQIANLKRKQLQSLCKANGIRANSKNIKLVKDLQHKLQEILKKRSKTPTENNKENRSRHSNVSSVRRSTKRRRRRSSKMSRSSSTEPPKSKQTKSRKSETNMEAAMESIPLSDTENTIKNPVTNNNIEPPKEKPIEPDISSPVPPSKPEPEQPTEPIITTTDPAPTFINLKPENDTLTIIKQQTVIPSDAEITNNADAMDIDSDSTSNANAFTNTMDGDSYNKKKPIYYDIDKEDDDDDYNNNPNGNNGSFVDIEEPATSHPASIESPDDGLTELQSRLNELQQDYQDSDTNHDSQHIQNINIQKLGVSNLAVNDNHDEEIQTNSVSVAYINHNMDISDINNGSMISDEIPDENSNEIMKNGPVIINNDVDILNQSDVETPDITQQDANDSSLSVEKTPTLAPSTERFIRQSLNVENKEEREERLGGDHLMKLQFDAEDEEEDEDDVDMEVTPAIKAGKNDKRNQEHLMTLHEELGGNESPLDESVMDTEASTSVNISMLGMDASRITIDEEDHSKDVVLSPESLEPIQTTPSKVKNQEEDDESSPEWKHTPFKALEIFKSLTQSLSASKSKSVTNDDSKQEENDTNHDQEDQAADAEDTDDDDEVIKDMNVTPNGDDDRGDGDEEVQEVEDKDGDDMDTAETSETVENLFYESPTKPDRDSNDLNQTQSSTVTVPKSEIKQKEKSTSISMTFGDGQKFEFKSVYSPSKSLSVPKVAKQKSVFSNETPINKTNIPYKSVTPDALSEKTMAIRAMMEEVEREYDSPLHSNHNNKKNNTDQPSTKTAPKREIGKIPDWNAIHNKQIFSRQPDLQQWDQERKARQQRLFGRHNQAIDQLTGRKMSTPGVRQRSKSLIEKKKNTHTHNSEKKTNRKRVTIVPSSNDHKFNQTADSKLNRKVQRKATPYKRSTFEEMGGVSGLQHVNKKASVKPKFMTSFTETTTSVVAPIEEEEVVKKMKVPKKKLAYDPDKVKSKLFQSTSSSSNKITKLNLNKNKKSSQTPQVVNVKNNENKKSIKRDWSTVKSKIDTGNNMIQRASGIKRKLSWSKSDNNNQDKMYEPSQKKRRMSQHPPNTKRWQ